MGFLRPNENTEQVTKRIFPENNRLPSSAQNEKNKFTENAEEKSNKTTAESQCEGNKRKQ